MCGGNFKKGGQLRAQSGKRTYSDKRVEKIQVQSRSEWQHGHASKSKSSKDDELIDFPNFLLLANNFGASEKLLVALFY